MHHPASADPFYDLALVLLAYAIGALDIYAALQLIRREAAIRRHSRIAWLACGAALMGSGVYAVLASTADLVVEAVMRGAGVSLAILGLTLIVGMVDRRLTAQIAAFESLFMHHPDAVYALDLSGIIKSVNPAAAAMTGYEGSELTGIPFVTPIAAEARSQVQYALFLAGKGSAHSYETTLTHRSGRHLIVSVTNVPIVIDGRITGMYGFMKDITDRMQAEATLQVERTMLEQRVVARTAELQQANAELARAARLKDEFLASVSHELRTPLNAVLGLSESLYEGVYGPINGEQLSTLRGIIESGQHLLSLINDILELSKIEAGKATLHYDDVVISELCEASLRIVRQQAIQKRLTISLTTDHALISISGDVRRLKQILVNLLSNAVKFTPEGGAVGLEVDADAARALVQFTVWDTGIGIAAEDLARLFQPFIQLDSGLARQYSGTGLGLALVDSMVKLHGGTIAVESALGRGSRFCVTLPWEMPAESPSEQVSDTVPALWSASSQPPAPPTTILLAEDNELNIAALVDYLTANGYRVIVARNGHEALARLRVSRPDLILMDIQMPEMDGLEAIRLMRGDERLSGIPIIALTALAMPGDEARCLAAGANAYLSKPVSLHTMTEVIAVHLQQRTPPKEHTHAEHNPDR